MAFRARPRRVCLLADRGRPKGSSGVAAALSQTDGAIGYVDVAYSLKNHFTFAAVKNAAGRFQRPGLRGIAAAAASVKRLPADKAVSIVNTSKTAKFAYPIATFTWAYVAPGCSTRAERTGALPA